MFAILAEVRGQYADSFEPKGILLRDEMSSAAASEAYMYIVDDKARCCENGQLEFGFITRTNALKWAERGYRIVEDNYMQALDYHSHSWMTISELEKAYEIYLKHQTEQWPDENVRIPLEYQAILAAMKALEQDGENEVRIVFWFDN
jgi:hypothetical protein